MNNKNFIVAGMPRGGTTTLYHHFQKHPSIFVPFRKEPSYFSYNHYKGQEWYESLYKDMRQDQIGVDIGTYYFIDAHTIEKIKKYNSNIKVIISVRDPVEYALSLYKQRSTMTWDIPPFKDFIVSYCFSEVPNKIHLKLTTDTIGDIIDKYRDAFGDNLMLYSFSYFRKDPLKVLRAIEAFVGIPPYFNETNFENVRINAGNRKNIRIFSSVLKNEALIATIETFFPHKLVRHIRNFFDRASARSVATEFSYPKEDIEVAEEAFADQRIYLKELFSESQIILGSGTPFSAERDV